MSPRDLCLQLCGFFFSHGFWWPASLAHFTNWSISPVPNHFPSPQKFETKKKKRLCVKSLCNYSMFHRTWYTLCFIGLDIFRESVSRVKCRGLTSLIEGNIPAVDNSGSTLSVMLQVWCIVESSAGQENTLPTTFQSWENNRPSWREKSEQHSALETVP